MMKFEEVLYERVMPATYLTLTLIGVVGNILVIYIVCSRCKMRTVFNILLTNLALTDLLFLVVVPPLTSYSHMHSWDWQLGEPCCQAMYYVTLFTGAVTVYTLLLLTCVQYLTVVHEQCTEKLRTVRKTMAAIAVLWVIMALLCIPVLYEYGLNKWNYNVKEKRHAYSCDLLEPAHGKYIYLVEFLLTYLLPLLVITFFSVGIVRYMLRQRSHMLDGTNPGNVQMRQRQVSLVLGLVVGLFAVLWLPVQVHLLVGHTFGETEPMQSRTYKVLTLLWFIMAYGNSCINPFIYIYASHEFRLHFKEIVCRTPAPSQKCGKNGTTNMTECNSMQSTARAYDRGEAANNCEYQPVLAPAGKGDAMLMVSLKKSNGDEGNQAMVTEVNEEGRPLIAATEDNLVLKDIAL